MSSKIRVNNPDYGTDGEGVPNIPKPPPPPPEKNIEIRDSPEILNPAVAAEMIHSELKRKYPGVSVGGIPSFLKQLADSFGVSIVIVDKPISAYTDGKRVFLGTRNLHRSDPMVAAAVAHEVGHIEGKHLLESRILALVLIGGAVAAGASNPWVGGAIAVLSPWIWAIAARLQEYRADRFAVHAVGRDAVVDLLRTHSAPRFRALRLNLHPRPEDRIRAITGR